MSEVIWRWGALNLPFSSLTFFAAIIICLMMTYAEGRRKLLPESKLIDFLLLSLVGGMMGGRLVYAVFFDPDFYFEQPLRLLYIQDCGFSFWGGLVCAFIAISFWAYRSKLIVERYFDAAAPALAFCLSFGYMGAPLRGGFMSRPLPWAIVDEGAYYHPDGAYAIILLMTVYLILRHRRYRAAYEGEIFFWFLLGCSMTNIILDFIRDLPAVWGIFTAGQLFSFVMVVFTTYFVLAGPQISISFSYLSGTGYRRKSAETVAVYIWLFILTGVMVLLYFFMHQPSKFLQA
ncbi:MAG: hypothetical protein GX878_09855 [Firmicutes bacterium]|nr:hypothetical protein [Bacillota bacterium]